MKQLIKVLIVDDSAFMRKIISDIVKEAEDMEVVGTAINGQDAIEKAKLLSPDVITLDVEMHVMNGLNCLKLLKDISDARVLMLSSYTKIGAESTIQALEVGAVDFITKPSWLFGIAGEEKKKEIIDKIRIAYAAKKYKLEYDMQVFHPKIETPAIKDIKLKSIVAIGTSTGGPRALQSVISSLPGTLPAAFLVVQHMPLGFTRSLAERLDSICELNVKEAENGDELTAGTVYIAPGDYHMTVVGSKKSGLRVSLNKESPVGGHRPAVDVMMKSLAKTGFPDLIGVIMTGMGSDGSEGIKHLKKYNNGFIISQDEDTCVVYGMPRAAASTGEVDLVLPLDRIADAIVKKLGV
jgi:two-component system chemotaxis response regulator CheB